MGTDKDPNMKDAASMVDVWINRASARLTQGAWEVPHLYADDSYLPPHGDTAAAASQPHPVTDACTHSPGPSRRVSYLPRYDAEKFAGIKGRKPGSTAAVNTTDTYRFFRNQAVDLFKAGRVVVQIIASNGSIVMPSGASVPLFNSDPYDLEREMIEYEWPLLASFSQRTAAGGWVGCHGGFDAVQCSL